MSLCAKNVVHFVHYVYVDSCSQWTTA